MIGNKIFIFEDGIYEDDELNDHGVNLSTNKSKKRFTIWIKKDERKSLSSNVRKNL